MRQQRGLVPAMAAAALLAGLVAGCGSEKDEAVRTVESFLTAWENGDHARAASFTDDPETAETELSRLAGELRLRKADLTAGDRLKGKGGGEDSALVPFKAALTLDGAGRWTYSSAAEVRRSGGTWKVHFTPSVLHPKLKERTRLVRHRELPPRAPILAADGSEIAADGTVWSISIWPAKLTDPDRAYRALRDPALGVEIDTEALRARVEKAGPDQSVPVVTLREEVYRKVREKLLPIPGLQFRDSRRALAKHARALVGTVQPATKETLANAGSTAVASDVVGASGLQYRYQRQLAGTPGVTIRIVDTLTKEALGEVYRSKPVPGRPLRTTIDLKTQRAAEQALEGVEKKASLVAIRPSTGEVLAVAGKPETGENRAFTGRFPPGSTFKVITAAALLQAGVKPEAKAPCPRSITVNGQRFENQAEFELPEGTTFREDFAHSCNTGIIALRGRLGDKALRDTAAQFGIGGEWQVGASSFDGSVPVAGSENDKAASMIGQGRVEVSALVMASVAATVKDGSFRQPVLVPDAVRTRHRAPKALPPDVADQLRTMMRAVVTEGSGKALRDIPGAPAAKTGTAEYGTDSPPRTHAWMIGFRGDLAFAVLIEDGGSGGRDAGPVAAKFLGALG